MRPTQQKMLPRLKDKVQEALRKGKYDNPIYVPGFAGWRRK